MSAVLGGKMSFELTAFIVSLIVSNISPISEEVELDKAIIVPVKQIKGRALTRAEIESIIGKIVREEGISASSDEIEKLAEDIYEWQGYLIEWRKVLKDMLRLEYDYNKGKLSSEKYLLSLLEQEKKLEKRIIGYILGEENVKSFCNTKFKTHIFEKEKYPFLEEMLGRVVARNIVKSGIPLKNAIKTPVSKIIIEEGVKWLRAREKLGSIAVIFEDLNCLVLKEEEGILYLKKAKPEELRHRIHLKTANILISNFLDKLQKEIENWTYRQDTKWNFKVKRVYSSKCRKIPAVIRFSAILEESRFILAKKLLEIHVFILVDADSLCRYGQTFKPYHITEVSSLIRDFEEKTGRKYQTILCLASLTGWTRESINFGEKYENSRLRLYLVDIKNKELYYNRELEHMREFIEILKSSLELS